MVPGAHVFVPFLPTPQTSWHAAPEPQVRPQAVDPEQSTVQPPSGHVTAQPLLPLQVTVPLLPTDRLQVLVPSHVRLLLSPALRSHVLPPPQVDVQPAPHVPLHADLPSQVVVQPVPQSTAHEFFETQLYETPFGGAPASETPPSAEVGPSAQVPPAAQVQVVPLQEHEPLHAIDDGASVATSFEPQPVNKGRIKATRLIRVRIRTS